MPATEVPAVEIQFSVLGLPETQGDSKLRGRPGGKAWIQTKRPALTDWRNKIAYRAQDVMQEQSFPYLTKKDYAVQMVLIFSFPKSKSIPKRIRRHVKRPDLDKLIRAVGDSLSGVIYEDDSQIDRFGVRKKYADARQQPQLLILIRGVSVSQEEDGA